MAERIDLGRPVPGPFVERLVGRRAEPHHFDTLVGGLGKPDAADMHRPEATLLLAYRRGAVSRTFLDDAYDALCLEAKPTNRRPGATGGRRTSGAAHSGT